MTSNSSNTVVPEFDGSPTIGAAIARLYALTGYLRTECPWDQKQSAVTIVPHTVEEAYEVAAAARAITNPSADGACSELEDELGDLLFQICFLAMWCSEHDPGIDLGTVADAVFDKLVERHPHVFGDAVAHNADEVRSTWDAVKAAKTERGIFAKVEPALPALQHAGKVQQRAARVGFDFGSALAAVAKIDEELAELRQAIFDAAAEGTIPAGEGDQPVRAIDNEIGDLLFSVVNVARLTRTDPDLALRESDARFRARIEGAEQLAAAAGDEWQHLPLAEQEAYYQAAKANQVS